MSGHPDTAPAAVSLVGFALDRDRYAVETACVVRALPLVALAPLPGAPAVVAGVCDFHGELIPVMNVRLRFGLRPREPALSDQLLVLRSRGRTLAFAVDAVEPAFAVAASELTAAQALVPGLEHIRGIVRLPESGLVLVQDVDRFLSLVEAEELAAALSLPRA